MDKIAQLKVFISVAEAGSFTHAANKLGMSVQLVSKYVAHLEEDLGARFFNRTTRKIHLTEAGEQCLMHARGIIDSITDMEGHIGQMQTQAKGLLRISAPVSFATLHLSGAITDFMAEQPNVSIDLELNDRKVNVIDEGYDLALRIGQLDSSSLVARKIASIRLVMCASPEYLNRHGMPAKPDDLLDGHYLHYSYMNYTNSDNPLFKVLKQRAQFGSGLKANNGEVLVDAAMSGLGYVLQPTFIVSKALQEQKLKVILSEFEPEPVALYAVYPHRKLISNKLKVFLDFLGGYYGSPPYWDTY